MDYTSKESFTSLKNSDQFPLKVSEPQASAMTVSAIGDGAGELTHWNPPSALGPCAIVKLPSFSQILSIRGLASVRLHSTEESIKIRQTSMTL